MTNKRKPWLNNVKYEDLPNEELKLLARCCGMKVVISLLKNMQGQVIRIPTKAFLDLGNKYIKEKFDGTKKCIKKLVDEFEISEKHIRELINKID